MFAKTDIEKYFNAEKAGGLLFMIIGQAGIIMAVLFFFVSGINFYKGASVPLLLTGVLFTVVGYTVYKRSDSDRKRNVYAYDMNPAELKEKELPRMRTVMRNFVVLRYAEIFLFLAGAGLYVYFIRSFKYDFWRGFGLALAVMALLALTADLFAEKRGRDYTKGIESFVK